MISDFTGNMMVVVGGALFLLFGGILYTNVQTSGLTAELAGECQVSDIPIPPLNEVSGSISCDEASLLKNTGLGTMGGGILLILAGFMLQLRDKQQDESKDDQIEYTPTSGD